MLVEWNVFRSSGLFLKERKRKEFSSGVSCPRCYLPSMCNPLCLLLAEVRHVKHWLHALPHHDGSSHENSCRACRKRILNSGLSMKLIQAVNKRLGKTRLHDGMRPLMAHVGTPKKLAGPSDPDSTCKCANGIRGMACPCTFLSLRASCSWSYACRATHGLPPKRHW